MKRIETLKSRRALMDCSAIAICAQNFRTVMRLLNVKIIAVGGFHVTTETVIDVILPFPSGSKSTAPGDRLRLAPERLHAVSPAPYTSFFRRTIIIYYYYSVNALCLHALGRTTSYPVGRTRADFRRKRSPTFVRIYLG